jgi:hypothetical protein
MPSALAGTALLKEVTNVPTLGTRGVSGLSAQVHQKLDSGLNILIGQAAQRQKFLSELRAIGNSN